MTRARNSANLASQGNLFVDITNDRTGIGSVVPAQNLHVAGTAGFHADVTFTGDNYNATWDRSHNSLRFVDNARIRIGTDNDLQLYHNSSNNHSYIIENGSGSLLIQSNDQIALQTTSGENMVTAAANGAVQLMYDHSAKFQTTAYGTNTIGTAVNDGLVVAGVATVTTMNVTGVLTYDDVTSVDSVGIVTARTGVRVPASGTNSANYISVGTGDNLKLYHDSSSGGSLRNGTGNLEIQANSVFHLKTTQFNVIDNDATHYHIRTFKDDRVELYFNNAKKFETTAYGTDTTGTTGTDGLAVSGISTFSSDLNVAENIIHTGDTDTKIRFSDNKIQLQAGGTTRVQTTSTGAQIDTILTLYGAAGNPGRLRLQEGGALSEIMVARNSDSSSFLYFKTEISGTTATRALIDESGHFRPNVDSTYDLGITGTRWRNVYADTLYGDGSNLTGITQTTINNNAANKVIMGSNTANTLEAVAKSTLFGNLSHGQNFLDDQNLVFGDASDMILIHQSSGAKSRIRNTNDSGSLDIESTLTRFTNKDGSTEKVRISSNGNILVGKTADAGKGLEIYQSANAALRIQNSTTGQGAGDGLLIETAGSDALFWNYENAAIRFGTNNIERLRITSDGKLIVGATAPTNGSIAEFSKSVAGGGAGCHITVENTSTNSVNNTAGIHLKTDTGTAKFFKYRAAQTFIQSASGGASELLLQANGAHPMRLYAGDAERVRIEDTGEVYFYGNQTSVPEGDFGFRWDRNSSVDFTIKNTNNTSVNAGARIKLIAHIGNIAMHYVNNGGFYLNNSASGYLHYYSGGTSRLYIDTSGNVNINNAGTIATSNGGVGKRLGIKSNANNIFIGETESASNFGLILESRVSGRSGDARASQIGLGNGVIDFYTAASGAGVTKRMEIASGGDVNITGGNLHVGTDGATANFTDSGGGNTKHIEIGATGGGDALLTTHASGYGIGYFGYHTGMDRLVVACDQGGGNNSIDFVTTAGTSTGGSTDNLHNKNPRFRIQGNGGFRAEFTDSNEVHAISNYDHGNQAYTHRGGRTLTSNGAGWDGNESSDGADPILVLSVADRAGNSDIGDAYGIQLHSESQDNNDYGPLIGWTNRSNSGNYNTTYAAIVGQKTGQATDTNWSSGSLHFFTNKPGAGSYMDNTADLTIDSVGRISTPRQPSFLAEHGHNSGNHKQKSEIYMSFIRNFQHVRHNTGNCFNNSTGKFTAPIAGIYLFHIDFTMDGGAGSDDSAGCYFRVENNSANYNRTHSGVRDFHSVDPNLHSTSTGYEVNASFHTIEKLAAGATCGFYFTDWDATNTRITTCFFSGYKVG